MKPFRIFAATRPQARAQRRLSILKPSRFVAHETGHYRCASPAQLVAQLPYVAELFAAVVCAGAPTAQAAAFVGRAAGGAAGGWFEHVAQELQRGRSPRQAWLELPDMTKPRWPLSTPQSLAPIQALARDAARAADSGAALAKALRSHATGLRAAALTNMQTRAARAGVTLVLPLVCCFLPAFVLLGVAPILVDLLRQGLRGAF